MDDFRSAYGLAAPAPVAAAARSPGALGALGRPRVASWAGPLDRGQLRSYRRGPADPRGALVDCSDRPLLCMSVSDDGRDVVVGSADHAAYGVDAADPRPTPARTYHGKNDGHAEWVAVPNSTTGLGGPDQTSEFSSSVKSKSIRLIFGRIDCSRRVLEAQPKRLRRNNRVRSH